MTTVKATWADIGARSTKVKSHTIAVKTRSAQNLSAGQMPDLSTIGHIIRSWLEARLSREIPRPPGEVLQQMFSKVSTMYSSCKDPNGGCWVLQAYARVVVKSVFLLRKRLSCFERRPVRSYLSVEDIVFIQRHRLYSRVSFVADLVM